MTPEIIEFYVENPGLVTREVKQLLIALSDCYDVAKRYTGIFCEIAIDEDKIKTYGGGGGGEACTKLLKEKKIGRFNEDLNVDNGCGGGGKQQKVRHNEDYDIPGKEPYKILIENEIRQKKILDWDIEIKRITEYKKTPDLTEVEKNQCQENIKILEKNKIEYNEQLKLANTKYSEKRKNTDRELDSNYAKNPLFFLQNSGNTCWIDSLIYFLFAINKFFYTFKHQYNVNFQIIGNYIIDQNNKNKHGFLNWDNNFLSSLNSDYQRRGFADLAEVAFKIFAPLNYIALDERILQKDKKALIENSQYLMSQGSATNLNKDNFFLSLFKNYVFLAFPQNLILQNPTNNLNQYDISVGGNIDYLKSLIIEEIMVNDNQNKPKSQATYKLVSFIVNLDNGIHFICYFLRNSQWWKYDDTKTDFKFEKETDLKSIQTKITSEPLSKIVLYNYSL